MTARRPSIRADELAFRAGTGAFALLLGRYKGYRLSELMRFKAFLKS